MKQNIQHSIKLARERAGFTQAEVEKELSLRKLSIKDYETGRLKLPVETAVILAKHYCITVDELINQKPKSKALTSLTSLFHANEVDAIFDDPIIKAYLESFTDKLLTTPLYELLVINLSEKEKVIFHNEMMAYLYSLVAVDGKILSIEIAFLNEIDMIAKTKSNHIEFKKYFLTPYYSKKENLVLTKNLALRHFIIWILFLLAKSDYEILPSELEYIESVAEELKLLKSNYISIRDLFYKE